MDEKTNIIGEAAQTATSLHGILAGLTFTTTVLLFSFRTSIPFSEVFITLSLVTTILFIFSAVLASDAGEKLIN